jgi:Lipoprotein confined to pathogenic Mycobacterium
MSRTHRGLTAGLLVISLLLAGCIKPNTFDPHANPGRNELDRLQKIVDDRPDLETVEQQLASLDATIRATIAKYSPQTQFSTVPYSHATNGCKEPFSRSIARQVDSDLFAGRPAPTGEQWLQIVTELAPVFDAAGFRPNNSPAGSPPLPLGSSNNSQIRDDGALIDLVNGENGSPLHYSYDTGCHLPAAWRAGPPPPGMRPPNDPNVHYPYLYGSPGGRNSDAY